MATYRTFTTNVTATSVTGAAFVDVVFYSSTVDAGTSTMITQTWYDMGDGVHLSETQLNFLTDPYEGKSLAELEVLTQPYT